MIEKEVERAKITNVTRKGLDPWNKSYIETLMEELMFMNTHLVSDEKLVMEANMEPLEYIV